MNIQEAIQVVNAIGYKPDWSLSLYVPRQGNTYIQWTFYSDNYVTGEKNVQWKSRKWYLSEYMCESEIVQTALAAALMAEEHEAREAFRYCGKPVFNPHVDIRQLMSVCEELEVRA